MPSLCFLTMNATSSQTIASGSVVKLTGFNAVDLYPTGPGGPWDAANSRFTCPTGHDGRYLIVARGVQWGAAFSSPILCQARVNTSTLLNFTPVDGPSSGSTGAVMGGVATVRLSAGDYVDLRVRQQSGSNQTVTVEEFTIQRIPD